MALMSEFHRKVGFSAVATKVEQRTERDHEVQSSLQPGRRLNLPHA
jgi:hypothetical protein